MATRSFIALQKEDRVQYVYCHWDGYPEHHLPILNEHYKTTEKVQELINGGSISILAENIKPTTETHSFETPEENVTVFYHRDGNEPLEINEISDIQTLLNKVETDCYIEHIYLFTLEGMWQHYSGF